MTTPEIKLSLEKNYHFFLERYLKQNNVFKRLPIVTVVSLSY